MFVHLCVFTHVGLCAYTGCIMYCVCCNAMHKMQINYVARKPTNSIHVCTMDLCNVQKNYHLCM